MSKRAAHVLLGMIAGAIAGALFAATYNHNECSSVAQGLSGCQTLNPGPFAVLGVAVGALAGFLVYRARQ